MDNNLLGVDREKQKITRNMNLGEEKKLYCIVSL